MKILRCFGIVNLLLALAACGTNTAAPEPKHENVFTEHRFLTAAKATKDLGEDCVASGKSDCKSGICFHYQAAPDQGWVCSRQCQDESECPQGWSCSSIYPGPGNEFCIPPVGWTAKKAAMRAAE